jgi:hypothetical protein
MKLENADQDNILQTEQWLVNDKFCVFGKDFEDTFRKSFTKYNEIEGDIKKELGDSKPLVAREVAKIICNGNYNENDEGWECLKKLADKIKDLK